MSNLDTDFVQATLLYSVLDLQVAYETWILVKYQYHYNSSMSQIL
jgi:hypothetical protein